MMVPTFNLGPSKICLGSWGSPAPELWDIPTSSPLFNQFVACIWQTGAVSAGQLEDCALWDAFAFLTYLIWSWTYPQTFNCLINVWDALFFFGISSNGLPRNTPHYPMYPHYSWLSSHDSFSARSACGPRSSQLQPWNWQWRQHLKGQQRASMWFLIQPLLPIRRSCMWPISRHNALCI